MYVYIYKYIYIYMYTYVKYTGNAKDAAVVQPFCTFGPALQC